MCQWMLFVGFVLLVFVVGFVGSWFLFGDWYVGLVKFLFNLFNSVFVFVWSVFYLLMGIVVWCVWCWCGIDVVIGLWLV